MAQSGLTVEVPPPPTVSGWGGLLPTLDELGLVLEYSDNAPDEDVRWEGGHDHRPVGCGDVTPWAPCSGDTKTTGDQPEIVQFNPVVLYADDTCGATGVPFDERVERARINLLRKQSNAIANELWTGTMAAAAGWPNLSLSQSAEPLTGPGVSSPLTLALGALQDNLAECLGDGQAGFIHASRATVTEWWRSGALYWEQTNGYMRDAHGNIVIASGGYDGSDPDGIVTSGFPWAYASGPIVVRLAGVQIVPDTPVGAAPALTTSNDITVFAERTASYQLDGCCLFGIAVDLCGCCSTEGS